MTMNNNKNKAVNNGLGVFKTAVLAVVCAVCAFTLGFYSGGAKEINELKDNLPQNSAASQSQQQSNLTSPASAQSISVSPLTEFVFIKEFTLSGKILSQSLPPPEEAVGCEIEEISAMYREWTISSFSIKKVVFIKKIEAHGPGTYLLCIKSIGGSETLTLMECSDEGEYILKQTFATPVELFSEEERTKLYEGIPILSEEALDSILQNYAE